MYLKICTWLLTQEDLTYIYIYIYEVKWSRYRPGVAQRVGRDIALLFNDCSTRMGWVVSSTPRPHFTPRKDTVPILQEAGWVPGPGWKGGKSHPNRYSIPDRTAPTQTLYRLRYQAHIYIYIYIYTHTHTILHTHPHPQRYTQPHKNTHTQIHIYTHTHTHIITHTHTHKHPHT